MEMPADMESVQVPTYFFFPGSQTEVPWPWKGWPGPISPLKSVMRQRPPHPITLVSVPLEVMGGAPGAMNISTVASQVPSSCFRIACSGPGFGPDGMPSCAATRPARSATPTTTDTVGGPHRPSCFPEPVKAPRQRGQILLA
jgi:hypothetical protein